MRLNIHISAVLVVCLPLLHASAQENGAPDDAFSLELKEVAAGLKENGHYLYINSSRADSADKVRRLLAVIADELIIYDDRLRALRHPPEERMPMLRKRFRKLAKQINRLGGGVSFDEKTGYTEVRYSNAVSAGFTMIKLYPLFDMKRRWNMKGACAERCSSAFWVRGRLRFLALLFIVFRRERARSADAS